MTSVLSPLCLSRVATLPAACCTVDVSSPPASGHTTASATDVSAKSGSRPLRETTTDTVRKVVGAVVKSLCLEQLHNDSVSEAEAHGRDGLAAKHLKQPDGQTAAGMDECPSIVSRLLPAALSRRHAYVSYLPPPQMALSSPALSKPSNTTPV